MLKLTEKEIVAIVGEGVTLDELNKQVDIQEAAAEKLLATFIRREKPNHIPIRETK